MPDFLFGLIHYLEFYMKPLYLGWEAELLALVNKTQNASFVEGDLVFTINTELSTDEATRVDITPGAGVPYYGDAFIVYTRRDMGKAFLGVPISLVVGSSVDFKTLVESISTKYGITFDEAVDFTEDVLAQTVDFSEDGDQDVTIPLAETSYIWSGELAVRVQNSVADLTVLIANGDLANLIYLNLSSNGDNVGSITAACLGANLQTTINDLGLLDSAAGAALTQEQADALASEIVAQGIVESASQTDLTNGILGQTLVEIVDGDEYENEKVLSYDDSANTSTTWVGPVYLRGLNTVKPIRYVLKATGKDVTFDLTGWDPDTTNVDWGDGSSDATGTDFTHTYAEDGDYTVVATGTVSDIYATQTLKGFQIVEIVEWNNGLASCVQTNNCQKLVKVPASIPATWTTLDKLLAYASIFNGPEVTGWDTSNITSMSSTFMGNTAFNQDISNWDTSKVTDMDSMLAQMYAFNQPIGKWDVSKVGSMWGMFSNSKGFQQDLSAWNTANLNDATLMFSNSDFNGGLAWEHTSNLSIVSNMFSGNKAFNQDISGWNTLNLNKMDLFMNGAIAFNQDLSGWNVDRVTSGQDTFDSGATAWQDNFKPWYVAPPQYVLKTTGGDVNFDLSGWTASAVTVDWGDGNTDSGSLTPAHTYAEDGDYTITVSGAVTDATAGQTLQGANITEVVSWANGMLSAPKMISCKALVKVPASIPTDWTSLASLFQYATAYNGEEAASWDTSNITSLYRTFGGASAFNQDLSGWDTSKVTDMRMLFSQATAFNQPIGSWDVGAVTQMDSMFESTKNFDQDLSGWDTASLTSIKAMFSSAIFNHDISNWNTSAVTAMDYLMEGNEVFNQDLSGWDVSAVTSGQDNFDSGATAWQDDFKPWYEPIGKYVLKTTGGQVDLSLGGWNADSVNVDWGDGATDSASTTLTHTYDTDGDYTITVTGMSDNQANFHQIKGPGITEIVSWDNLQLHAPATTCPNLVEVPASIPSKWWYLRYVFMGATSFNSDVVSSWDVSNIRNMSSLFKGASAFNQDLSSWNTASLTTLNSAFEDAVAYDQPMADWDVSNVTDLGYVFSGATLFNQDIGAWNTAKVTKFDSFLYNAAAFNQDLSGWDVSSATSEANFDSGADAWQAEYKPTFA